MRRFGPDTQRIVGAVGQRFVVELPVQASGGYQWFLEPEAGEVLSLAEETIAPAGAGVGASAVQRFVIEPRRAGTSALVFTQRRFTRDGSVIERIEIEVRASSRTGGPRRG